MYLIRINRRELRREESERKKKEAIRVFVKPFHKKNFKRTRRKLRNLGLVFPSSFSLSIVEIEGLILS